MSAGRKGVVIPILAVTAFAAMLGTFVWFRARPAPDPQLPSRPVERPVESPGGLPATEASSGAARSEAASAAGPAAGFAASPSGPAEAVTVDAAPAVPSLAESAARQPPSPTGAAFDVVRVEPSGESVIAGRAAPGSTVTLVANGRDIDSATADAAGQFVMVPKPLLPGSHEIGLRGNGDLRSSQSVTVVVSAKRNEAALVTMTTPGLPTEVLSRPTSPVVAALAGGPEAPVRPAPAASASRPASPAAVAHEATPPAVATPPVAAAPTTTPASAASALSGPLPPSSALALAPMVARPGSEAARDAVASPATLADPPRAISPSRPEKPAAISGAAPRPEVRIASVETAAAGRLYVSGLAAPGATVRLYLNDTLVAPGVPAPDGRLAFSIERGIAPGDYRVRLDEVDPVSGAVRSRAEVPFNVPPTAVAGVEPPRTAPPPEPSSSPAVPREAAPSSPPVRSVLASPPISGAPPAPALAAPPASRSAPLATASPTLTADAGAALAPGTRSPSAAAAITVPPGASAPVASGLAPSPLSPEPATVVIPEVSTHAVVRGDHLWRISRRVYGEGIRYTVIYGANTPQIRNPNLIYPGQVFVLPVEAGKPR